VETPRPIEQPAAWDVYAASNRPPRWECGVAGAAEVDPLRFHGSRSENHPRVGQLRRLTRQGDVIPKGKTVPASGFCFYGDLEQQVGVAVWAVNGKIKAEFHPKTIAPGTIPSEGYHHTRRRACVPCV
jgi:hypothetical protein